MSEIKDWSTTASLNNDVAPDGFPEGMAPSDVNNAARELMAAVRTYYDSPEWRDWGHTITYGSGTTFTTATGDGDTTSVYHVGRRIKAFGTVTTTIYGVISNSSHSTQTTVTVVWDSGSLSNESLTIWVGTDDRETFGGPIPVGTKMTFLQASAPTGWTQDATNNDRALRLVSGTGGGTGGTHPINTGHNHQWYNFNSGADDGSWNVVAFGATLAYASNANGGILGQSASASKLAADYYTTDEAFRYLDVIAATKD